VGADCRPARFALAVPGTAIAYIPVDDEGIHVEAIGTSHAVYVTPAHQYPLGVSMTAARRVALPRLWDAFLHAREALDIFSPTLYQLALADFLREGRFARHIRRMRDIYRRRRDALLAGLARHCHGKLVVHNADAGLHVPV
jgi:DNA-binding transcriptional MocR family regulator